MNRSWQLFSFSNERARPNVLKVPVLELVVSTLKTLKMCCLYSQTRR